MVTERAPVLIVAKPGALADGLRALLAAMPRFEAAAHAVEMAVALELVASRHPALIILDFDLLSEAIPAVLDQIKERSPDTRCIVLVDHVWQQERAVAAGAAGVFLKGSLAADLMAMVERLAA